MLILIGLVVGLLMFNIRDLKIMKVERSYVIFCNRVSKIKYNKELKECYFRITMCISILIVAISNMNMLIK